MSFELTPGVWPTMLTPFDEHGRVDYSGLENLVEWYVSKGVAGLFAVCQSSEMFELSLDERVCIARTVMERAGRRCGVIASGHISNDGDHQVEELNAIAETGVDAVVLVANRPAEKVDSDLVWRENTEALLGKLPASVPLGIYECPYPYKRLLSNDLLAWLAETGRFFFLKDTSCDRAIQRQRARAVQGSSLRLYNANSATLLHSLRTGYAGYSGVMANFHPHLYVWLCRYFSEAAAEAEKLQAFLGVASVIESHGYPANAKHFLAEEGLALHPATRVRSHELRDDWMAELDELRVLTSMIESALPVSTAATGQGES
jgi:4-hydroxy-tetrahydrodipicolinate synthase